jgi:hypothetical protein
MVRKHTRTVHVHQASIARIQLIVGKAKYEGLFCVADMMRVALRRVRHGVLRVCVVTS